MIGFPKHLNTKQDYLNMLCIAPEQTKDSLRELLESRFSWLPIKKLKATENPKETDTKKIISLSVDGGELVGGAETERWLYELQEDQNAWFFQLGFTVEEAKNIVQE